LRSVERGQIDKVRNMLQLTGNALLFITDEKGFYALHIASRGGHAEIIRLLLENNCDVNCRTVNGDSPLHVAVQAGKEQSVILLIESGADLEARNFDQETALDIALTTTHETIVQLLLTCHFSTKKKSLPQPNFIPPPLQKPVEIIKSPIELKKEIEPHKPPIIGESRVSESEQNLGEDELLISQLMKLELLVNEKDNIIKEKDKIIAQFEDSEMCKICFERKADSVILDCGHFVLCQTCSKSKVWENCIICSNSVNKIILVYRS